MTKTTHLNGVQVRYYDEGSGDAIVILHGWGSNADSWNAVLRELVAEGFRVIAPDLPGFGGSDEPPSAWTLRDYTEFVRALIQEVGAAPCTLAGHSFGGRVSIDYAARYGHGLRGVVLVGAAGITRPKETRRRIIGRMTKAGNAVFSLPLLGGVRPLAERGWYRLLGTRDYQRSSPRMKEIMHNVLDEELRPVLKDIAVPALLLWGELDEATPLSDAKIAEDEIPNARLVVVEGKHHSLQREAPEETARAIAEFVKQNATQ